jgi:hypothetical protein
MSAKPNTILASELAVLESKWYLNKNTSVRGWFDLLCDLHFHNPNLYYYEMFSDDGSLRKIAERVIRMGASLGIKYLYVAGHGSAKGLLCPDGEIISRTMLKNMLVELGSGSRLQGLFLASCLFGEEDTGEFLLIPPRGPDPSIKWVAGYAASVEWVDSCALEFFFWNKFFLCQNAPGPPLEKLEWVARQIVLSMDGLARDLQFHIFKRKKGAGGGVVDLLSECREEQAAERPAASRR